MLLDVDSQTLVRGKIMWNLDAVGLSACIRFPVPAAFSAATRVQMHMFFDPIVIVVAHII